MSKMNFDDFKDWSAENIDFFLPHSYDNAEIHVQPIVKTGVHYDSLTVRKEGQMTATAVNLNEMFNHYENGMSLYEIGQKMAKIVQMDQPRFNTDIFESYDNLKENLFIRVCNASENKTLLQNIPHKKIEDLAITYHVKISDEDGSLVSTTITNDMIHSYGISKDQLHRDALKSSVSTMPARILSMPEAIGIPEDLLPDNGQSPSMLVITNDLGINGAAATFYPNTMDVISEKLGGNYYILPSSIHETIAVPEGKFSDYHTLETMVHDVNMMQVSKPDQLSYNVYHYDIHSRSFELAESYARKTETISHIESDDFGFEQSHEHTNQHHTFAMKF